MGACRCSSDKEPSYGARPEVAGGGRGMGNARRGRKKLRRGNGSGEERGGSDCATPLARLTPLPSPPGWVLPALFQPSRPHLASARPLFPLHPDFPPSVAGGCCVFNQGFKYTKGLPRPPPGTRGNRASWDAEPRYEPLSRAKPSQFSKGISERRRVEQAPAGRTPVHSQQPQGDTQSPGAQRWRQEWRGERSPALCGFSASWAACWAEPSLRHRPSSSSLAMSPPKQTKSWQW